MDYGNDYIKMVDCPEIQEHIPEIGDFYWEKHIDGVEIIGVVYDTGNNDYKELDWGTVWLPRQDDLQEMILDYWWADYRPGNVVSDMLQRFIWWLDDTLPTFTSMEQLWLGFVMREKYNKVWSGTEWIKQNKGAGVISRRECPE